MEHISPPNDALDVFPMENVLKQQPLSQVVDSKDVTWPTYLLGQPSLYLIISSKYKSYQEGFSELIVFSPSNQSSIK